MASSVGSDIFALISLLVIALLVLLLLRHYLPLRTTPAYLLVPVFLALALPCSIILLVPIDLASASASIDAESARGVWLPPYVVLVTWRITYWLTFALTWFILPVLGEYVDSGFRDARARIWDSVRSTARYQLLMLGIGAAGLVYIVLQTGFHAATLKALVMALAYAWGLVLAIGLMGHGCVALPRRLFRNARVSDRLRRLQTHAPKVKDRLDDAVEELEGLEEMVAQLKQRKSGVGKDLQDWIDELADTASLLPDTRSGRRTTLPERSTPIPAVLSERYLADLARRLKRARHKKARFLIEWTRLCQQAHDAQTILDAASTKRLDFGRPTFFSRLAFLTPTMRYRLHMHVYPLARILLAALLAIASAMLVFSEVVKAVAPQISIIGLTVVMHSPSDPESSRVGFGGQLIAAAWLLYMDACALYAITDVKVWGNRALVKRHTYSESACWYSLQVAKLTVPLSYNFITLLTPAVYRATSFFAFLGQLINLTPLGQGFSSWFPCFVLVPVLASLFNLYGRVRRVVGFGGILEDESEENPSGFGTGGWREGRALIEREWQARGGAGGEGDAATLGLPARGASLDLERGRMRSGGAAGTLTPPIRRQPQPQHSTPLPTHIQDANRQFNSIANRERYTDGDDDDDTGARHFYQDLAERVRNTFDTAERPEWLRNFHFKTPKWMQQDGHGGEGSARWFGGGRGESQDGRLRI
ncbi:hypothetical protein M433DRAFT_153971 [Acidomyces richmondensis BFW]|nr:MAG: hypothetical protein FE78DRAFT_85619 [Acidomyces sp. 'richmondensis']KYG45923.1 hypothetical protein M433DRAFT_153971 [Acidomyces richmondensis BFW]